MEKILILGLAGYRITRFFIEDSLIERPRKKVLDWFRIRYQAMAGKNRRFWFNELYTLITCAFCMSIWISFIVWNLYDRADIISAVAHVLAVAGVIAIVYDLRPDEIAEEIRKSRKGNID
jgi:uncharacterized membrane protein YcjF (UPF0283 family)